MRTKNVHTLNNTTGMGPVSCLAKLNGPIFMLLGFMILGICNPVSSQPTTSYSITVSDPPSENIIAGHVFSVENDVMENGNGSASSVIYCVEDNTQATLLSVEISGSPLTVVGTPPGLAGATCFDIGPLGMSETVTVTENWGIDSCFPEDDLNRQVFCDDVTCSVVDYSDFPATDLVPDPEPVDITLGLPSGALSTCGNPETLTIMIVNTSAEGWILENVSAVLDMPDGFLLSNISIGTLSVGGEVISDLPDLDPFTSLVITVDVQADCSVGAANDWEYIFTLNFDPLCSTSTGTVVLTSGPFGSNPAFINNLSATTIIDAYFGLIFDAEVVIENGSSLADADLVYYCVSPPSSDLELVDLLIDGTSYFADFDGASGCYIIPSLPRKPAPSVTVTERWKVIGCTMLEQNISRRIQYGCQGDFDCEEQEQSVFKDTKVTLGMVIPELIVTGSIIDMPACYTEDLTNASITIMNNGGATAKDMQISINGNNGVLSNYTIIHSDLGPITPIDVTNTSSFCAGSLSDLINEVTLAPGESLDITYSVIYSCTCNGPCAITGIYNPSFTVQSYLDDCGFAYGPVSKSFTPFNASIEGFVEGPIDLNSGEEGTIEYTITEAELDWLRTDNKYPNAYMETDFILPCGLDPVLPLSVTLIDANNVPFAFTMSSVTAGAADSEIVNVRWPSPLPSSPNFVVGPGMIMTIDVVADCDEKTDPLPGGCGNPVYNLTIAQETYLVTDDLCTATCARQKIWLAPTLDLEISCPQNGDCEPWPGINFLSFTIERTNFGLGDNNNNQKFEGEILNPNIVQKDRFLEGDTLKATFQGIVSNPDDQNFTTGFARIFVDVPLTSLSVLSASVFIEDRDMTTGLPVMPGFTCNVVPFSEVDPNPDPEYILVDFSLANLAGCGAGVLPAFYDDMDSISVCIEFIIKEPPSISPRETKTYETDFFVSDTGIDDPYQCGDRRARMTQVALSESESCSVGNFGACDIQNGAGSAPTWRFTYSRHYGAITFDEFANEIRPVGLPKEFTFTKPPEFEFRPDAFFIQLRQRISTAHNILTAPYTTIDPAYLVISGDQVTFLAESYFNSLPDPISQEIAPDEGYTVTFGPRIQGNCRSEIGNYSVSYSFSESVDPNVYCTPMIMRPGEDTGCLDFDYTGGAEVVVITEQDNITLCTGTDTVGIIVRNLPGPAAPYTFLTWDSPDGSIIVTKIVERSSGTEIIPNAFGIFELSEVGFLGNESRRYIVHIRANDCKDGIVNFVAGWDCEGYPTTVFEALCSDPSSIMFTNGASDFEVDAFSPTPGAAVVPLCSPILFEVEIGTTRAGSVRDINTDVLLPPGMTYVDGSLMIAFPCIKPTGDPPIPPINNYIMAPIPPSPIAGGFTINVSALDPFLDEQGLAGFKNPDSTRLCLKFEVITDCDYINGRKVTYSTTANGNCGDPLPPIVKQSTAIFIENVAPPMFDADIVLDDIVMNPCNGDKTTSEVLLIVDSPPTGGSIQYILPPGLMYVPDSYMSLDLSTTIGGDNPSTDEIINESQILTWPFIAGLMAGDIINFKLEIMAVDIGQICADTYIEVLAFSSSNAACASAPGGECAISVVAGEAQSAVTIVKPDLVFNNFEAELTLTPGSPENLGVFNVEICNNGAGTLEAGQSVTFEVWEDLDLDGVRDPLNASMPDQFLFSVTQELTVDLAPFDCITLMGEETFPSGSVCTIIGVLNPETTCTCSEQPSFQVRPEIIIDFEMEYEVCSTDPILIGPDPITNDPPDPEFPYGYEWLSVDGSNLENITDPFVTPAEFMMPNTSGSDIVLQYALRTFTIPLEPGSSCFEYDTVTIVVHSADVYEYNLGQICSSEDIPYPLPSPNVGGSDFVWVPSSDLTFPGPDGSFALVDVSVPGPRIYTLTFLDGNGCPSQAVYNFEVIDCGDQAASLGDYVWFDFDMDGVQDGNEPGIEGIVVTLLSPTGMVLATTTTDATGFYEFPNLTAGDYVVQFDPLPGFTGTSMDSGGDDAEDSDADPSTGITLPYTLTWGEHNPTIDAGFIPECSIEIELLAGPCLPSDDDLVQELTINVIWEGNPYAYAQFLPVIEFLTVSIPAIGYNDFIPISDVSGELTITVPVETTTDILLTANAVFQLANLCFASSQEVFLSPCIYDLALQKTATNGPNFQIGDILCLDIQVINQGLQSVSNVKVVDYLPDGLGFVIDQDVGLLPDTNAIWLMDGSNVVTLITENLDPGEMINLPLKVELLSGTGPDSWTNFAEIASFQDTLGNDFSPFDEDSTPDQINGNDAGGEPNGDSDDEVDGDGTGSTPGGGTAAEDEDDHDPYQPVIFDLALIKTIVTPPPYAFGDLLNFQIEVFNQGNETANTVTINDYIPEGFSFMNVPQNPVEWSLIAVGPPGIAQGTFTDPILPGTSMTFEIYLKLEDAAPDQYVNVAEISGATDSNDDPVDSDFDSTPDDIPGNDPGGNPDTDSDDVIDGNGLTGGGAPGDEDPATDEDDSDPVYVEVPAIEIVKTSNYNLATGEIEYTYVVTNTGNVPLTCVTVMENEDDFTGNGVDFPDINEDAFVSLGSSTDTPGDAKIDQLEPDEEATFTATYEVVPEDLENEDSEVVNRATATGEAPGGDPDDPDDDITDVSDSGNPEDEMDTEEDPTVTCIPNAICSLDDLIIDGCGILDAPTPELNPELVFQDIVGCGLNYEMESIDVVIDSDLCVDGPIIINRLYRLLVDDITIAVCPQDITIQDITAPVIVCPSDLIVPIDNNVSPCDLTINFNTPNVFDDCDMNPSLVQTAGPASGDAFILGTTEIVFEASDACGNTSECRFNITLIETGNPEIECPISPLEVCNDEGLCTADISADILIPVSQFCPDLYSTFFEFPPGILDNDSGPPLPSGSFDDFVDGGSYTFPLGSYQLCWTIENDSGVEVDECCFIINVNDCTPPEIPDFVCPSDITLELDALCVFGDAIIDLNQLIPNLPDVCVGDVFIVDPIRTFSCTDLGTNTLAIQFSDASGNLSAITFCEIEVSKDETLADWENPGPLCVSETPYQLSASNSSCGIWSGDNVSETGELDISEAGVYSVTYLVGNNVCNIFQTHVIEVLEDYSDDDLLIDGFSICLCPDEFVDLTGLLQPSIPETGTWNIISSEGTLSGLVLGQAEVIYQSGCGSFTLEYQLINCDGQITADQIIISVSECPNGDFDIPDQLCQNGSFEITNNLVELSGCGDFELTFEVTSGPDGNALIGGAPIVTTISGFSPVSLAPAVAVGTYTLSMTISDLNDICDDHVVEQLIEILPSGDPAFSLDPNSVCSSGGLVDLILTNANDDSGNPLIGDLVQWSGIGVTDNGTTGQFDPSNLDAGIYLICVVVGHQACDQTFCLEIEVGNVPVVPDVDDFSLGCQLIHDEDEDGAADGIYAQFDWEDLFPGANPGGSLSQLQGPPVIWLVQEPGINTGLLVPAPGCYEIQYTVTDEICGQASNTALFIVGEQPEPEIDLQEAICWDGATPLDINIDLLSPNYALGTPNYLWTAEVTETSDEGVITVGAPNGVDPMIQVTDVDATLGESTFVICVTETLTTEGCGALISEICVNSYCESITVVQTDENLDPSWDPFGPECNDEGTTDLDALVISASGDTGGVFSGEGVSVDGSHPNYVFNPTNVTIPASENFVDINICYTLNTESGCSAVECHDIRVYNDVNATLNDLTFDCTIAPSGNISLSALFTATTTEGGSFSFATTPALGAASIVGNTLQYNQAGCYHIQYNVAAFAGATEDCAAMGTAYVAIPEQPQPSFDIVGEVCWDGIGPLTIPEVLNSPTYDSGTPNYLWRVQNPTGGLNIQIQGSMTANPTIRVEGIGPSGFGIAQICLTESFNYAALSCGGMIPAESLSCLETTCHNLIVTRTDLALDASWTPFGPICATVTPPVDLDALVLDAGGDPEGIFTGEGVSVAGAHPNYQFNPFGLGGQTVAITYTYTSPAGCTISETHNIEVLDPVNGNLLEPVNVCIDESGQFDLTSLFGPNTTAGGTFSIFPFDNNPFVSINGDILTYDPNQSAPFAIAVRYQVGDDSACDNPNTGFMESCTNLPNPIPPFMDGPISNNSMQDDCYAEDIVLIRFEGGYEMFLDIPEICFPQDIAAITQLDLAEYLSIVGSDGQSFGNGLGPLFGFPMLPPTVSAQWDIVAVNGNQFNPGIGILNSFLNDLNGEFNIGDPLLGYSDGINGNEFAGVVTIRVTLTDQQFGVPGFDCIAVVEEAFEIFPPPDATLTPCECEEEERRVSLFLDQFATGQPYGDNGILADIIQNLLAPITINYSGLTSVFDETALLYSDDQVDDDGTVVVTNLAAFAGITLGGPLDFKVNEGEVSYSIEIIDGRGCSLSLSGACPELADLPFFDNPGSPSCFTDGAFVISIFDGDGNLVDLAPQYFDGVVAEGNPEITAGKRPTAITPGDNHEEFDAVADFGASPPDRVFIPDFANNTIVVVPDRLVGDSYEYGGIYQITLTLPATEETNCEELSVATEVILWPSMDACFPLDETTFCPDEVNDITLDVDPENPSFDDLAPNLLGRNRNEMSVWRVITPTGAVVEEEDILGLTGNANGDGFLNIATLWSEFGAGEYTIEHELGIDQCKTFCENSFEIIPPVDATISDLELACSIDPVGLIDLTSLFVRNDDVTTSTGGVFTGDGVAGNALIYNGPGCYEVIYTVSSFETADGACMDSDNAFILIPREPQPSFDIQDQVCFSDGDSPVELPSLVNSPDYGVLPDDWILSREWTLVNETVAGADISVNLDNGDVTIFDEPDPAIISGVITVRLTETISYPACGSIPGGSCSEIFDLQINVEDGTSLDAGFVVSNDEPCLGEVVDITANMEGGVFTGDSVNDNGDGRTATLTINNGCGDYAVTYTISSPNGCTNSNTRLITTDRTDPVFMTLPADMTVECDGDGNELMLANWLSTHAGADVDDNCTIDDNIVWEYDLVSLEELCGITNMQTYRFTAIDECGNSSFRNATFSILDRTPPDITPGVDMVLNECDQSNANNDDELISWLNNNAGATATDACNNFVWTNDYDVANWVDVSIDLTLCGDTRYVDVVFTATDECGNADTFMSRFSTGDITPPVFENCPRPDIVENAETDHCDAYVNFSLPIAFDNCSDVTITNLSPFKPDDSGERYETGDRFPVGTTIMIYEAEDACGNTSECSFKVIVNDYWDVPEITCPENIVDENDEWLCGAIIDVDPPEVKDDCIENVIVSYEISFGTGPDRQVLATGIGDPGDFLYPVGESTVTYCAQDQPLLLISEITQDVDNIVGGMLNPPVAVENGDDYIEITNFGPSIVDLSCLVIERTYLDLVESYVVPNDITIQSGDVLVLHYGEEALDNGVATPGCVLLHYGEGAANFQANDQASYRVYYGENDIDAMTMFADAQGGIIRKAVKDTNTPADFVLAEECLPISICMYHYPEITPIDNGGMTSLQSIPANTSSCSFTVTVSDIEPPSCGILGNVNLYSNDGMVADQGSCNQFVINVPDAEDCIMADVNVSLVGNIFSVDNLIVSLTSPEGSRVILLDKDCPELHEMGVDVDMTFDDEATLTIEGDACTSVGAPWNDSYQPTQGQEGQMNMLMNFYTEKSAGDWILEIFSEVGGSGSFDLQEWSLEITCMDPWSMDPVMEDNDLGQCGAEVTWIHPYFVDNCKTGEISVEFIPVGDTPEMVEVEDGILIENFGKGGYEATEFFPVGTTTVKYTLIDAALNMDMCSFDVTITDAEDPVITQCPDDITIYLGPGECTAFVIYDVEATDNCEVVSVIGSPESGTEFEIGTTEVEVIVSDEAGNTAVCTFNVNVVEFIPESNELACNNLIQLSLDADCKGELTGDMILEGDIYRCYDNYCMEIADEEGNVIFSGLLATAHFEFDLSHIGQEFTVTISDCLDSDNSCWGKVFVEDKLVPEIMPPDDVTILCGSDKDARNELGELITGEIKVLTCELSTSVYYEDDIQYFDECNDPISTITRTFYLTDESGNTVSTEQTIDVVPFKFEQISWPDDITLSCSEVSQQANLTLPDNTGYPKIGDLIVNDVHGSCNISHGYDDQELWICGGSYEILRTWIIRDRCDDIDSENPMTRVQLIEVIDTEGPVLHECPEDMTVSTDPWACSASISLPVPEILEDACGDLDLQVSIFGGGSTRILYDPITGDVTNIYANNMNRGTHTILYVAKDDCGNVTTCEFDILVIDEVPPVAIANQHLVVSLTSAGTDEEGYAKLYAKDVDNGSYDVCSDIHVEIRRDGSPVDWTCGVIGNDTYTQGSPFPDHPDDIIDGGDYVKFCCEDLNAGENDDGQVKVWIRVWDDADADGIYGSAGDNFNEAWTYVQVEDKLPIQIQCPDDVTINCYEDPENTNLTGMAIGTGTCAGLIATPEYDYTNMNQCGGPDGNAFRDGFVIITWTVESNGRRAECEQIVRIVVEDPFNYHDISWPGDIETDCRTPMRGEPSWNEVPCSLVGSSMEQQVFEFEEDACYKELNTWTIIDWCTYDPEDFSDEPHNGHYDAGSPRGIWTHTQIVKVIDTSKPEVECSTQEEWATEDCLAQNVLLTNSATDEGSDCPSPWLKWEVCLDINYDWTCDHIWTSDQGVADASRVDIYYYVASSSPGEDITLPTGVPSFENPNEPSELDLPVGTHRVLWTVNDGCGNVSSCTQFIEVTDGKAPTPYCIQNLSTAVMDHGGTVEIWASDFDLASEDNCTAQEDLLFTFADGEQSKTFECADLDGEAFKVFTLEMHVTDEAGESDFCFIQIRVNDNGICSGEGRATVAGNIQTRLGDMVENSEVSINSVLPEFPISQVTEEDGNYAFVQIPMYNDYDLTALRNDDHRNGVSTLDMVIIMRHVIGLEPLNDPYRVIAADVNADQKISALDLIQMRRLILGITDEFQENDSWRFVDAVQVFDDVNKPWPFMEVLNLPLISEDMLAQDFVGVKIGDVSGDAEANSFMSTEVRTNTNLKLETDEQFVQTGDIIAVPISSEEFDNVYGYQFTFKLDGLSYQGVETGVLKITKDNFGLHRVNEGLISTTWSSSEAVTTDDVLFTLLFKAETDDQLSKLLSIGSEITKAEAYSSSALSIEGVKITFRTDNGLLDANPFALYQNQPNPFTDITQIGFVLPESGEATMTIYDVTGKVVKIVEGDYSKGYNEVSLKRQDLGMAGMLYYQLDAGDHTATKKMIIVK